MVSQEFTVSAEQGLHMRPASAFSGRMQQLSAAVTICHGGKEYNAKSILSVLSACIVQGAHIRVVCEGDDEGAALAAAAANPALIPKLIEWGLDEFSVSPASILQTRKAICEYE